MPYYDERPGCFEYLFELALVGGFILLTLILAYRFLTGL